MKQMRDQITGIAGARDNDRRDFLLLVNKLTKENSETEERLFQLAQNQTEYISSTATALAQIAAEMRSDRFCPFGRTLDGEGNARQIR